MFSYIVGDECLPAWNGDFFIVLLVLLFLGLMIFYWIQRISFSYTMDETKMTLRKGILVLKEQTVPHMKVKNVHMQSNIISKLFGLVEFLAETEGSEDREMSMRFSYIFSRSY